MVAVMSDDVRGDCNTIAAQYHSNEENGVSGILSEISSISGEYKTMEIKKILWGRHLKI